MTALQAAVALLTAPDSGDDAFCDVLDAVPDTQLRDVIVELVATTRGMFRAQSLLAGRDDRADLAATLSKIGVYAAEEADNV